MTQRTVGTDINKDILYFKNWRDMSADDRAKWAKRWPNFTPSEVACKGTGELKINETALDLLQEMRNKLDAPLLLNCAYRSPEHNKKVGGSPNSMHLQGEAFDLHMRFDWDVNEIALLARKVGFSGIGFYDTFLHVDTGRMRFWDLRKEKKPIPFSITNPR